MGAHEWVTRYLNNDTGHYIYFDKDVNEWHLRDKKGNLRYHQYANSSKSPSKDTWRKVKLRDGRCAIPDCLRGVVPCEKSECMKTVTFGWHPCTKPHGRKNCRKICPNCKGETFMSRRRLACSESEATHG